MRRRVSLRSDRGQAAVELALVLPILVALLLGIVQFGIVWNNYVTLTDATRAGARAAAVGRFAADPVGSATAAVRNSAGTLNQAKLSVSVPTPPGGWSTPGTTVTVTATYPYSFSILGFKVKSGTLTSTTQERLE
jgi:Flp pilus assembly protein TadG